ncbi:MAG TPA: PLP-dependent aminotransferase family protein [Stellaceae bacterium]|nr:PLP-dependent aminotransferase family protein [Stellaceae bacterium]
MHRNWLPQIEEPAAPPASLQRRLLDALARDIGSGALAPGARLPTHRDLAYRLGISVGTVTKVYAEAERRGLVASHVGRGTFVAGVREESRREGEPVDLALNLPPASAATAARLEAALARLRRGRDLAGLAQYPPPLGNERHRRAGAAWLDRHGCPGADWRDLMLTMGAQHAMSLALAALARPGDTILVEAATYHGVKSLAQHAGYRLRGIAMDAEGLRPDALEEAARPGAVLYTLPSLQNPTARSMSRPRREAIAALAARHALWIVEDDICGALAQPDAPPPLAALLPERSFYVSSLSKTVMPGLRTGFLLLPRGDAAMRERLARSVQATAIAAPAFGPAIAAAWIEDGTADAILAETRQEAAARRRLAGDILGCAPPPDASASLHLWLDLPELEAERVAGRALREGVAVTPTDAPIVDPRLISGLRICLGAAPDRASLARGLRVIAAALRAAPEGRLVF